MAREYSNFWAGSMSRGQAISRNHIFWISIRDPQRLAVDAAVKRLLRCGLSVSLWPHPAIAKLGMFRMKLRNSSLLVAILALTASLGIPTAASAALPISIVVDGASSKASCESGRAVVVRQGYYNVISPCAYSSGGGSIKKGWYYTALKR